MIRSDLFGLVSVLFVLERLVHAPRGVLETGLGPALGTRLDRAEAHIVELELRGRSLDGARLFVAPMATLLHHGRSPECGVTGLGECTARRA